MLLTFDFKTVEEAQEFLEGLFAGRAAKRVVSPTPAPPAGGPSKDSEPAPKKRGRRASTETKGPDASMTAAEAERRTVEHVGRLQDAALTAAGIPESVKLVTKDTVRAALSAVIDAKGLPEAEAILAAFGAQSIGGLKPEDYAAVVRKCEGE